MLTNTSLTPLLYATLFFLALTLFISLWRKFYRRTPYTLLINEVGNVLLITDTHEALPDTAIKQFNNALSKMAILMKAIQTTRCSRTHRTFSIFNYRAVVRIFSKCPFLSFTDKEEGHSVYVNSKNLQKTLATLLYGQEVPVTHHRKAHALFHTMQNEITRIKAGNELFNQRVTQVVLECRYIEGESTTSLRVLNFDIDEYSRALNDISEAHAKRGIYSLAYNVEHYRVR